VHGELDKTNARLLQLLADDGRASVASLGRQLHVSRTAVQDRIERLERDGWIKGYTVITGHPAAETGAHHAMLFITITVRPCAVVLQALRAIPEISRVWSMSGDIDAIAEVKVAAPKDLSRLTDRLALIAGIGSVRSQTVLG
jgi:Lrp/AsnC family transcriptional regulator, leucine-responsive regulatory protein